MSTFPPTTPICWSCAPDDLLTTRKVAGFMLPSASLSLARTSSTTCELRTSGGGLSLRATGARAGCVVVVVEVGGGGGAVVVVDVPPPGPGLPPPPPPGPGLPPPPPPGPEFPPPPVPGVVPITGAAGSVGGGAVGPAGSEGST